MTQPISFFVPGVPKGQPRPRAFAKKMGNKFVARVYDAATAEGWKSQIALAAKPFVPFPPWEGPVGVKVDFLFPRPKKHFRANGVLKPESPIFHFQKPDSDNCFKALVDCLTVLGWWGDDSQIAWHQVQKTWSESPGSSITIYRLEDYTACQNAPQSSAKAPQTHFALEGGIGQGA